MSIKKRSKRFLLVSAFVFLILAFAILTAYNSLSISRAVKSRIFQAENEGIDGKSYEVLARKLNIPWALDFLDSERIIFTERAGKVKLLELKTKEVKTLAVIDEVEHIAEAGLLGIAIYHDSGKTYVYLYYTYSENGKLYNKVARYILENDRLFYDRTIIDKIPGAKFHDGGRIKIKNGYLYITTGDALNPELAQDLNYLGGKILRLKLDGSLPEDNPFKDSPVYSYGHRNPQGIAWDSDGNLWETEHGNIGHDEINLIKPGMNYGWPLIQGDDTKNGMESPILHSGFSTWAPSGMAYYNGSLFFAGLRGNALYEFNIKTKKLRKHFHKKFGRLREVVERDGFLYILTSNRDGRGIPGSDDDMLIKIKAIDLMNED